MLSLLELTVTTREMRCKPVLLDCVRFSLLPLTVLEIELSAIAQPEPELQPQLSAIAQPEPELQPELQPGIQPELQPEIQPEPQPEQTDVLVKLLGKNWDKEQADITTSEAIQCKVNALQIIDDIRANGFTGVSVTTASAAKRNLSKYQKIQFLKKIGYPNAESLTLTKINEAIELVSTYVTAWYAVSFYNIPRKKS